MQPLQQLSLLLLLLLLLVCRLVMRAARWEQACWPQASQQAQHWACTAATAPTGCCWTVLRMHTAWSVFRCMTAWGHRRYSSSSTMLSWQ
jgi:hypothetical protein